MRRQDAIPPETVSNSIIGRKGVNSDTVEAGELVLELGQLLEHVAADLLFRR